MRLMIQISLLISTLILTSCSYTNAKIALNQNPTVISAHAYRSTARTAIEIGKITDNRFISDPKMIAERHGPKALLEPNGYEASQPVADVIKSALTNSLGSVGYQVDEMHSKYQLIGSVNNVTVQYIMTNFIDSHIIRIYLHLQLLDKQKNKVIWSQQIVGKSQMKKSINTNHAIRDAFDDALGNAMLQVEESPKFFKAAQRQRLSA